MILIERAMPMLKLCSAIAAGLLLLACSDDDFSFDDQHPFTQTDSLIEIHAPLQGEVLPANQPFIFDYAVVRGIQGEYVRIRVDKLRSVKIHSLNNKHHIEGLPPGPHRISVREYDKDGKFTGGMAEITVYMK